MEGERRKLVCPSCGHETSYDPRDCPRFLRFLGPSDRNRRKEVVVRCAGCGREQDVAES